MKRRIKVILFIAVILICLILLDTIQSKLFNNAPIFKVILNYNGGTLYQKHKGILVDTYFYTDGSRETVFKWEKTY